jgi:hypothetical protein
MPDNKKNKKVEGKKSTIVIQGPPTIKSDLRGGALDEFVAPKVAQAKEKIKEVKKGVKNLAGKAKSKFKEFTSKNATRQKFPSGNQKRKYYNNTYKEGK